jgi:heat-inducible transcriptional repressor
MAMLVLIAENGRVEQRMLPLDATMGETDVDALGARLATELHGVVLEEAQRKIGAITASNQGERQLLDDIAGGFQSLLDSEDHIFVGGVANLAGEQAFERETLSRLYETLEHQKEMLQLLASTLDPPVSVRIGSEHESQDLHAVSVVVAGFSPGANGLGSLGIIGPTRMDYERVIATANAVARMLEATLGVPDAP